MLLMKTDSQRKQEKNFINLPWLILLNREAKNLDMNCSKALYYIKERISPTERETNKIIRRRLNFWVETFVHYIRHLFFFYDQFAVSCQKNNLWNKIKQVSNSLICFCVNMFQSWHCYDKQLGKKRLFRKSVKGREHIWLKLTLGSLKALHFIGLILRRKHAKPQPLRYHSFVSLLDCL